MGARWERVQAGADYEFGARHYRMIFGLRAFGAVARGGWWLMKRLLLPLAIVGSVLAVVWLIGGWSWSFIVGHSLGKVLLIVVGSILSLLLLRWLFRPYGAIRRAMRRRF